MSAVVLDELVLSVHATSRGFAFVLFEGPESPFDWGVREIGNPRRNEKCVRAVERIIERYQPSVLVLEDTTERVSRRTVRIRRLYQSLKHLAKANVIDVHLVTKDTVRETFLSAGAVTKYEIALAIARQIPAFAIRLPRVRKPWMSEDSRQGLFDAAAMGLAFYMRHGGRDTLGDEFN
jgi:hypothetical protein